MKALPLLPGALCRVGGRAASWGGGAPAHLLPRRLPDLHSPVSAGPLPQGTIRQGWAPPGGLGTFQGGWALWGISGHLWWGAGHLQEGRCGGRTPWSRGPDPGVWMFSFPPPPRPLEADYEAPLCLLLSEKWGGSCAHLKTVIKVR